MDRIAAGVRRLHPLSRLILKRPEVNFREAFIIRFKMVNLARSAALVHTVRTFWFEFAFCNYRVNAV